MSESLESLLAGRSPKEPPEIVIIKQYVEEKFHTIPAVSVNERQIVITVRGAALAGALRPYLTELRELCDTQHKLVIRIQ